MCLTHCSHSVDATAGKPWSKERVETTPRAQAASRSAVSMAAVGAAERLLTGDPYTMR